MSKMSDARTAIAKVIKFGLTLPEGVGLLTGDGGLPMFAIAGEDRQITHWLIYLQRVGAGERPALAGQAFNDDGIADMGNGWKLGRLVIPDSEVRFAHKIVHEMEELVNKLNARDLLTEN